MVRTVATLQPHMTAVGLSKMTEDKTSPRIISKIFLIIGWVLLVFVFLCSNQYNGANVVFTAFATVPIFLLSTIYSIVNLKNKQWIGIENWLLSIFSALPLLCGFTIFASLLKGW